LGEERWLVLGDDKPNRTARAGVLPCVGDLGEKGDGNWGVWAQFGRVPSGPMIERLA
jgi:hypothetical protein